MTAPSRWQRRWPWVAAALSGLLMALCFPPFNASGFIFIALVPLMCAVWLSKPLHRAWWYHLRLGYVTGLVFFTITFSWLSELGPLFDSPMLRALPFLLALYLSIYPAAWACFAGWIAGSHFSPAGDGERPRILSSLRNLRIAALAAAGWVAFEWLRGPVITGFGWNNLAVALVHPQTMALLQIAEFTGTAGPVFLLAMVNAVGLLTILRLRAEMGRSRLRPHFDFSLTAALFVLVFVHGIRTLGRDEPGPRAELRAWLLQPNVPQKWKMGHEHDEEIFERLEYLHSLAGTLQPHLVVWPEASVPGGMLGNTDIEKFIRELAAQVPALVLGTDDSERNHNSAAFIVRGRGEVQFYDKRHLVPFGEYVPFRPLFSWLPDDIEVADFAPGGGPMVFDLPEPALKLGPLVCFEDTHPPLTAEQVRLGAHVLVNVTNDGWFGQSFGPEQHMLNAVVRAIENRRPLVRCTNTGVTVSVDATGRITRWMEPFTQGAQQIQIAVPTLPRTTFFTRHGEVFAAICAALAALAIVGRLVLSRRTQRAA
jgi:apolipoprotein N-acyltransferase